MKFEAQSSQTKKFGKSRPLFRNIGTILLLACIIFLLLVVQDTCTKKTTVKWQKVKLDFVGPELNETGVDNPFTDYRLLVNFSKGDRLVKVPGYFAADGRAGDTGASSGKVWRVWFLPEEVGTWRYTVSFRQGKDIAISDDPIAGSPLAFDGREGIVEVRALTDDLPDYISKGKLQYAGNRYLEYAETKELFIKVGPNSPENFLAYDDIDGTYGYDEEKQFIKSYKPHLKDWNEGDPTWMDGKGKGIIGAINYIAEMGMNVIYFLSMNIAGDGRDVWPYISHEQMDRFDCSKLDQWNIIFSHASAKNIVLHFVTQETENELLLDQGNTEYFRKLYYRELIARFGHHPKIIWNLGEENGPASFTPEGQNTAQRKAMSDYFKATDPYGHTVVVHTHSWPTARDSIVDSLYQIQSLDGLSLQIDNRAEVNGETKKYIDRSTTKGKTWYLPMDEIGKYWMGAMPDKIDPAHDTLRSQVLWGHLMAGGPGVEWYFGYKFPPADLDCEDWSSRENLWKQTKIAADFFQDHLPFGEMKGHNELVQNADYCFAKPGEIYVVYTTQNSIPTLDLNHTSGSFSVAWFQPKAGGPLQQGTVKNITAGSITPLGLPPSAAWDWVVLVRREN